MADEQELTVDMSGQETALTQERLIPRCLYAGDYFNDQSHLILEQDEVAMVGDRRNLVSVAPDSVLLTGNISLSAMPEEISIGGGYWTLNRLLISTVPSTTPTPIPTLEKSVPKILRSQKLFGGLVEGLESDLNGL